jgi:hypothetical protein
MRVTVIDFTCRGPTNALWAKIMHANYASIMPQVVATWCREAGHDVRFIAYTGFENLEEEVKGDADLVFFSAFTQAALLTYALSNLYRKRGAVTVLGGPHARCYPQDAAKYFDYVLGFTDRKIIDEVLEDCSPHRPEGRALSALQQPAELPSLADRWPYVEQTLAKAPYIKIVPMIGSLGCPYTCSFCIDSTVDFQPLGFDQMRSDLRFLLTKLKRPVVGWHDPNFGVRFDDYMGAIEDAVPAGRIDFLAESSLSLLSEPHLKRLQKNGFKGILPGIESWYSLGNKTRTGKSAGMEKVKAVSEHVNMMQRYVPFIQTNFVLGLDMDHGEEPFELSKRFIDMTPGAFPAYSLLSAFGQAAPLNLELQRSGRVLPFPFHFINNYHSMNVKPLNYGWREFYSYVIDLTKYAMSWRSIARRFRANTEWKPRLMNSLRAVSAEGYGRIKYYSTIRKLLDTDITVRRFFEGESTELPQFYHKRIQKELGSFYQALPPGAIYHDHLAYLNSQPLVKLA